MAEPSEKSDHSSSAVLSKLGHVFPASVLSSTKPSSRTGESREIVSVDREKGCQRLFVLHRRRLDTCQEEVRCRQVPSLVPVVGQRPARLLLPGLQKSP
jgi:hypothetical protein